MAKATRNRLQVDLTARHQRFLRSLGEGLGSGGDAETTRRVLDVFENIADSIRHGFKIVVVSPEDERPDAVPELTRAIRPESQYAYLVQRPHAWRKQLAFKGRRLTVGQLLGTMRIERWGVDRAAAEFDLPTDAIYEALDYGERFASLLIAEDAEDARAAKSLVHATAPG